TPMLGIGGFFFNFLIGGLTGLMLAAVPLDWQVHDTFFVVAHLHYVLIGGAVFPLFGAFYYWFPKITGRMLAEARGKWHFWLVFIWNIWISNRAGRVAGNNPWLAGTLEWATTSPPPNSNFLELPTVGGREPLWEDPPDQPIVTGIREDVREVLSTKPLDAEPD